MFSIFCNCLFECSILLSYFSQTWVFIISSSSHRVKKTKNFLTIAIPILFSIKSNVKFIETYQTQFEWDVWMRLTCFLPNGSRPALQGFEVFQHAASSFLNSSKFNPKEIFCLTIFQFQTIYSDFSLALNHWFKKQKNNYCIHCV